MKLKTFFIVILFIVGVSIIMLRSNQQSDEEKLQKIVTKKNYIVNKVEANLAIHFTIKPEWITKKSKRLNVKVFKVGESEIFLSDVVYRERDIYFSFHTSLNLQEEGRFIFPGDLKQNGFFSTPQEEFLLVTSDHQRLIPSQIGLGPSADFSFGIDLSDQGKIARGFNVQYSDFN
ncbi:hypothetical protein [Paenibacillus glufosinatiresistens]|uniref:hypothetical protein n=1 Tax=Paenibacillus glufosinatiresistens TaxID=3070657 RepID=UPI00286D9B13|nr:hypothetical protein [Paenibacillus sp. YX.27]